MGMSQERLAEALGLTFQQVQKYERGANRVGASRLHELSRILDVPVSYFFEEMAAAPARPPAATGSLAQEQAPYQHDPMTKRETLELVRAYYRITDDKLRRRVFELVKAMAGSGGGPLGN